MDPGFSNVVTAVFPDISKPLSAEQKRERAQNNWRKIRKEVFTQNSQPGGFEIISSLAITALPDLMKLNQKLEVGGPSAATDSRASYKSMKAKLHWFFLCPAFDDKGKWISIHQYHNMEFRKHNFWVDGLNPMSLFSATANLIITIFFFFLLIAVPFQIAYDDTTDKFLDQSHRIMAVFAIDTLLNIVTPLKPPKTDTRKVRRSTLSEWSKRYAKIFLVLDILTLIPWVHLVPLGIDSLLFALVHLLRSVRLPRMLTRIPIWIILHNKIEAVPGFGNHLSFMIPIGVAILLFIHLQSCVLYFAGKQFGFVSWNTQFPHWEAVEGRNPSRDNGRTVYLDVDTGAGKCFPNVFQTYRPETVWEQLITMFFVVFGGLLYAILVGLISSAAFCYDASGRLYRQKIDELSEYLHWKNIDDKTKQKLLSYYEFKYKGKYFEERNLLPDMNESLRRELASITCKQLIEKVPFLKREMKDGRDQIYLGKIATALVPIQFIAGDTIVSQGEQATEMYFILHGKVSILVNGNYVTSFADGGFFGEVALIANIPRTATVIAGTNCNLYTLSAKDFNSILLEFDDMKRRIDKIYEERMAKVRLEQAARLFMDRRPSTLQPVTENPNGSNDIH
ncbi:cyclic nucleotide-binding-like protein [Obelidium mucronatum]|nr:cyclic nucleotide-binding-like protein [Obelidium mucronatum]